MSLISHSIGGSFAIRQGDWKLCLSSGSGGWSAPKEPDAKKKGLPPLQLFNLKADRAEQKNLIQEHPKEVNLLQKEVSQGRCSAGNPVSNDREVTFLPKGVTIPWKN